jgi:hypothetical protein
MKYTDTQLKQALAKMLPDLVEIDQDNKGLFWKDDAYMIVLDNQLLNLCHLVWMTLDRKQRVHYSLYLREIVVNDGGHASSFDEDIVACCENATWQQRVIALCKVKNITIL